MDDKRIEIEFLSGPRDGEVLQFTTSQLEIGRDQGVHLQLSFDRLVSRRHARIARDGDKFTVEDLKSSYGTRVDGKQIDKPTAVVESNTICVGHTEMAVRIPSADSSEKSSAVSKSTNR